MTLLQLAFPWESNPIFLLEESHWDDTVVKSKSKESCTPVLTLLTRDALVGDVTKTVPGLAQARHQRLLHGAFQQLKHGGSQAQVDDEDDDVGEETTQRVSSQRGKGPHDPGSWLCLFSRGSGQIAVELRCLELQSSSPALLTWRQRTTFKPDVLRASVLFTGSFNVEEENDLGTGCFPGVSPLHRLF